MKIYFGESDPLVQKILAEYDINGAPDLALDDHELEVAGGFDQVMQELRGLCAGIAPKGPLGEYDVVDILSGDCKMAEQSNTPKVSVSSKTPNGREYPGLIVDIPGGEFEMGSINGDSDEHTSNGETVRVKMSAFRLSKTEVTVGQYKAYLKETGDPTYSKLPGFSENKKGDDYPVVGLPFAEKVAFARYYGATLPTAAQIEYASRGPNHTDIYGTPIDKAVILTNGNRTTEKVCGENDERANGFGVCDLAGNVWETTSDLYKSDFYDGMSRVDPSNSFIESGKLCCVEYRGGSFGYDAGNARAAYRGNGVGPVGRNCNGGFRCVWPQDSK